MRFVSAVVSSLLIVCGGAIALAADEAGQSPTTLPTIRVAHEGLRKLNWQLAVPTGTFSDRSVFETIDLLHELNIHHLELTPGQALEPGNLIIPAGQTMRTDAVAALMAKLKSFHMDIVSYGPGESWG